MHLDPNSALNSGSSTEPEVPPAGSADPLYTRLGSDWRDAVLKQMHEVEPEFELAADNAFSAEWSVAWGGATLPPTVKVIRNGKQEEVVVDTPEHVVLAGHSKYWTEQGARAIHLRDPRERRVVADMEQHLSEHFGGLARDLRDWIPEEEAVKPASIRYPESPEDIGIRQARVSERPDSGSRRMLLAEHRRNFERQRGEVPTQIFVERSEGGQLTQNFYIVASLRNSAGESLACWGNSLARFGPRDEATREVFASLPYHPITLVQLRFQFPANGAGTPKIESDLLYSPAAFKIARGLLRDEGIPEDGMEEREMHGHLVGTIRGAISRQVPGFRPEDRPALDDDSIHVDSLSPFPGSSDDNELLAICSAGDARFAVKVRMYIWFPEDAVSSNRHGKESPYIVRCACSRTEMPEL